MLERPSYVRIAVVCPVCAEKGLAPHRRFCDSEEEAQRWRCPDHGVAVRQVNRPYHRPEG